MTEGEKGERADEISFYERKHDLDIAGHIKLLKKIPKDKNHYVTKIMYSVYTDDVMLKIELKKTIKGGKARGSTKVFKTYLSLDMWNNTIKPLYEAIPKRERMDARDQAVIIIPKWIEYKKRKVKQENLSEFLK